MLYYFNEKDVYCDELLKECKLEHLIGLSTNNRAVTPGPDGLNGYIRTVVKNEKCPRYKEDKTGYYPNEQKWKKYGKVWIGWTEKPKAEHLMRRDCRGYAVETDIGSVIISPQRYMPANVVMDDEGNCTYEPKDICGPVLELIDRVVYNDNVSNDGVSSVPYSEHVKLAALALSINYVIGLPECAVLGILDTESIKKINQSVADMPAFIAMVEAIQEKKNAGDTQSIEDGEAVS